MMETVFLKLLNMSIAASWLVLAVIVLRWLLKRAPKSVRCILWGLVALRLICPFTLESAFSLIPSAETISPDIFYAQTPTINSGIPAINQVLNPIISSSLAPTPFASANPIQIWLYLAAYVWVIGIVVLLLYALVSFLCLRKRVSAAMRSDENIWICDGIDMPFILGVIRPRIYLPSAMDAAQSASVIAHEKAHIQRHDHWWKPLGYLLLTVYWFNPLLWVAYILLCRDIEFACDEKVIKNMALAERKIYSQALLSCTMPRKIISACPLAFGEVGVKERIKGVLNYRKPAFWIVVAAIAVCGAAAVCFLTNPRSTEVPEPFGQSYRVESVVYAAVQYDFSYVPQTAPAYKLTADHQLLILEDKASADWLNAGEFAAETLSPHAFDDYFKDVDGISGWADKAVSAQQLRLDNQSAWRLDVGDGAAHVFYLLLKQNNGELYLTYGYDNGKGTAEKEDSSLIRWVFKLTANSEEGLSGSSAAVGGVDTFDAAVSETELLDAAVSKAILAHNASQSNMDTNGADFACESHVTLAEVPFERWDETEGKAVNSVDVFAMVLYQEYRFASGVLEIVSGSHMPAVLTFDRDSDGEYILTNYWKPRSGAYYQPDIEKRFGMGQLSAETIADALDSQKFILAQTQACYAPAVAYGQIDTDAVIENLLDTILSSPATSSNPRDYIAEHSIDYREITFYGDYALRYVFGEFLKGNQTDLRGSILNVLLLELLGDETIPYTAENGQAYFDAWRTHVEEEYAQRGAAYMQNSAPKGWILIQMLEL